MKLIEITALIIFVFAIYLAGADSGNFTDFLWSKVVAVGLMGVAVLIFKIKTEVNNGNK